MTGISVKVDLQQAEGRSGLRALMDRMDDRQGFFRNVGERLLGSTKDNFRQERAPDGSPWQKLRRRTIKAREAKKQTPIKILRARGYLAGSTNYEATQDELRICSPVEYAAIHQLGGEIEKAARAAKIYRGLEKGGATGRRFVKKKLKRKVETDVNIGAHKITIPARPYLGVSKADETGIMEDAADWLMR